MQRFADALSALNSLKEDGVVEDYAVAGAMALTFWIEPVATYDLDVLVLLPQATDGLVSLEPLYGWARRRGYASADEHILVEGTPTQFIPSPSSLADEALRAAQTLEYEGVPVRVVRPEYLIALYSEPAARSAKRRERAAALLEWPGLNRSLVDEILKRHGLEL
jgi:hypothetical protein